MLQWHHNVPLSLGTLWPVYVAPACCKPVDNWSLPPSHPAPPSSQHPRRISVGGGQYFSDLFITHAPLFWGGADHVYESPLGDSCFVMNIHNPFMHCHLCYVTIRFQTVWRHNSDVCCHNGSSLATAQSATLLPCRVPLNGMFHQDSATQWNKTGEFEKYVTVSNFLS